MPKPGTIRSFAFALLFCGLSQTIVADESLTVDSSETDLMEIERNTKRLLPKLIPCIVALPGGSGVIISETGIVLTAAHVSYPAGRQIDVVLPNGETAKATTLGSHANSDAGAVKLQGKGPWPFLHVDTSESARSIVKPGQLCLALGYPLSLPRGEPAAVRLGMITSVSQQRLVTTCTIMGGDSGGPLVSLDGKLLGINSRVKPGITDNFHTPIQQFIDQWPAIAARRDIAAATSSLPGKTAGARVWLGVLGDASPHLARVRKVQPNSPAESAGLRVDDVITSIEGHSVAGFRDVVGRLRKCKLGDTIRVTVNRSDEFVDLQIRLRERP